MKDDMHEYGVIKRYKLETAEIEKETMRILRVIWNNRKRHERIQIGMM